MRNFRKSTYSIKDLFIVRIVSITIAILTFLIISNSSILNFIENISKNNLIASIIILLIFIIFVANALVFVITWGNYIILKYYEYKHKKSNK